MIITWNLALHVRQMMINNMMGTKLIQKLVQLSTWKATLQEPTIIRKMVPGPITVPTINKIYKADVMNRLERL